MLQHFLQMTKGGRESGSGPKHGTLSTMNSHLDDDCGSTGSVHPKKLRTRAVRERGLNVNSLLPAASSAQSLRYFVDGVNHENASEVMSAWYQLFFDAVNATNERMNWVRTYQTHPVVFCLPVRVPFQTYFFSSCWYILRCCVSIVFRATPRPQLALCYQMQRKGK